MKKPKISKWQMEKVHPYIPEMYDQLKQGRVSRREFLRVATLLGMGAGAAIVAAQCGSPAEPAAPASSGGGEADIGLAHHVGREPLAAGENREGVEADRLVGEVFA